MAFPALAIVIYCITLLLGVDPAKIPLVLFPDPEGLYTALNKLPKSVATPLY